VLSGNFPPGGGVALGDEGAGLAARHKAQIFEAVDRQTREGVVDHQMVDFEGEVLTLVGFASAASFLVRTDSPAAISLSARWPLP
jgi:hypothetical protein